MREKPLILLVDDEETFLEIASAKLQSENFETKLAHDFYDALAKAELLLPDLILSDVYMPPGPSGWDLAFALRLNPKTASVKFAFFTSLRDPWAELTPERKERAKNLQPLTFFSKMDDVEHLARKIAALIQ